MDKRKRNLIGIGALTIVATFLFFWLLYFLLGNPLLRPGMDLVAAMRDGAGVKRGDRIYLQGVDVGSVRSVTVFVGRGVFVDLRLNDDFELPEDSRVAVRGDVFGAHTVDLLPGAATTMLTDGDTIPGTAAAALDQLAGNLSAQVESVLGSARQLLAPALISDIHATASSLPATTAQLRASFVELSRASNALAETARQLQQAQPGPALERAVASVERSAQALTDATASVERSLATFQSVGTKIDNGTGTLGRLVNDDDLYNEMNNTLREMRALATDMRQNPSRYFNVRVF